VVGISFFDFKKGTGDCSRSAAWSGLGPQDVVLL